MQGSKISSKSFPADIAVTPTFKLPLLKVDSNPFVSDLLNLMPVH
jgi:hypothetical protein